MRRPNSSRPWRSPVRALKSPAANRELEPTSALTGRRTSKLLPSQPSSKARPPATANPVRLVASVSLAAAKRTSLGMPKRVTTLPEKSRLRLVANA